MSIIDVPNEILVKVFENLDGYSLNNAMQTCKLWYSLSNTASMWESLCQNYLDQSSVYDSVKLRLSNGRRQTIRDSGGLDGGDAQPGQSSLRSDDDLPCFKKYLPKEDEIRHFIRASDSLLDDWRFVYKFLSTCLIVDNEIEDIAKANLEFYQSSKHKPLIRTRLFKTIGEGISASEVGGIIYVRKGKYFENLTIHKPIHIYGEMKSEDRIYLKCMQKFFCNPYIYLSTAIFFNTLTWKAPGGTISCVNFTTNEPNCKASLDVYGTVQVSCSLFKNILHSGLRVRDGASVDVIECHFSGCKIPFSIDSQYVSFNTVSTFVKDLVETQQLEIIMNRLFQAESKESVLTSIRSLILLQRSEANKKQTLTLIAQHIETIVGILKSFIDHDRIQEEFCVFIEELSKNGIELPEETMSIIIDLMEFVMTSQMENSALITVYCSAIGRLSMQVPYHKFIQTSQIYVSLFEAVNHFRDDDFVLRHIVASLWNIVWLSSDAKQYILQQSGVSTLVHCLDPTRSIDVHIGICGILWNLSSNETLSKCIIEENAICKIFILLKSFTRLHCDNKTTERFVWIVYAVLNNLADQDEGSYLLQQNNIFNYISDNIHHPKSSRILEKKESLYKKLYNTEPSSMYL